MYHVGRLPSTDLDVPVSVLKQEMVDILCIAGISESDYVTYVEILYGAD